LIGKVAGGIDDGERTALEREYREHSDWLRSAARRRTGSLQAADDLVQEAFVRASRYPANQRNGRPLLLRILANLIKDRFRSRSREAVALDSFAAVVNTTGVTHADQAETVDFTNLILAMPKKLRDVFVLARFTPMTQPEIALRLGISVKTVEWRLAKALEYCVSHLGE
jgi:RNA polymerase sigma-70 factor (ECF subfamily)